METFKFRFFIIRYSPDHKQCSLAWKHVVVKRAMRADEPEIYIMYYKGTRDEEYLNKALEGIDPEYITVVNNLTEF